MSFQKPKCSTATFARVAELLKESQELANSYISKLHCSLDPVKARGYIDQHGILRPFKGGYTSGANETGTCPLQLKSIDYATWSRLPIGQAMSKQTFCGLATIDPQDKEDLVAISSELMDTASQIYEKIKALHLKNKEYNDKYGKESDKISKLLKSYKYLYERIQKLDEEGNNSTLGGQMQDARYLQTATHYRLIVWFFLAIILFTLAFRYFRKN